MTEAQIINELQTIDAMAKALSERCYHARKLLERISSPAPKGGKRKISAEQEAELRLSLRGKKTLFAK
jgi:hypothetical protein